jgi:hypothetical protein
MTLDKEFSKKRKNYLSSAADVALGKGPSELAADFFCRVPDMWHSAKKPSPTGSLLSAALGKVFVECNRGFAECPKHSANCPSAVVKEASLQFCAQVDNKILSCFFSEFFVQGISL